MSNVSIKDDIVIGAWSASGGGRNWGRLDHQHYCQTVEIILEWLLVCMYNTCWWFCHTWMWISNVQYNHNYTAYNHTKLINVQVMIVHSYSWTSSTSCSIIILVIMIICVIIIKVKSSRSTHMKRRFYKVSYGSACTYSVLKSKSSCASAHKSPCIMLIKRVQWAEGF